MMTNEIIVQTSTLTHAHAGDLSQVILRDPIPWGSLSLILVPVCVGIFIHGWNQVRQNREISWQPTFLKLATLAIASAMVAQICTSLYYLFYDAATLGSALANGAGFLAMCRLNLAYTCSTIRLGFLSVAICLALVIITNRMKEKYKDLPTNGDTQRR